MDASDQEIRLSDGRELRVRRPEREVDRDKMIEFFSRLPRNLRNYLRYNVTNPELLDKRLKMVDQRDHFRLIAEIDGVIVGDGSMDREPFGWTHHIAHVRTVVSPEVKHLGVATILLRRLVEFGKECGVDRFFSEVIKEHTEMIQTFENEGFVLESTLKDYAKDLKGRLHDVVVLSNDQTTVWKRLEEHIEELDIRMPNIYRGE